ncbi:MAG: hypothetical protein KDJ52_33635, partial [Anaerolineae bacterium]|nr:hypothetical protein [Anaerolineae bacterium]
IRCQIDDVRSRQIQFGYEVIDPLTGDIFATAYSKHICLDTENKVARMPDYWRHLFGQAAASA